MPSLNVLYPRERRDAGVGDRLRQRRREKGMTQCELAKVAGLSRETVYRVEAGRRLPSSDSVFRLEQALDLEPRDLMPGWDGFPGPHDPGLGNKVRERRRAMGLSLAQLSALTGFSVSKLSRFERCFATPPDMVAIRHDVVGRDYQVITAGRLAAALGFEDLADLRDYCDGSDATPWRFPRDTRSALRFEPDRKTPRPARHEGSQGVDGMKRTRDEAGR